MSLAHDLKLPDTCILVHFFGETSFIWPLLIAPKMPSPRHDSCSDESQLR